MLKRVHTEGGALALTHTHRFLFPTRYSVFATASLGPESLKKIKNKKPKVAWDLEILFM